jgi:hypothetical protein
MSIFLEREIDRISQDVLLLKRYLIKSKDSSSLFFERKGVKSLYQRGLILQTSHCEHVALFAAGSKLPAFRSRV